MQNKRFKKPKVPVMQMVLFATGVALLAIINSCGYSTFKVANALPVTSQEAPQLVTGSMETAVLTSQLHEKHKLKLVLSSKLFTGPVDIRIRSPKIDKIDTKKDVKFSISPSTVNLTPDTEVEVTISVDIGAGAPVIDDTQFRIEIVKSGTRQIVYKTEIDLNILSTFAVSN